MPVVVLWASFPESVCGHSSLCVYVRIWVRRLYLLQVQSLIRGTEKVQMLEWGKLYSVGFLPNCPQERSTIIFLKILTVLLLCVFIFFSVGKMLVLI